MLKGRHFAAMAFMALCCHEVRADIPAISAMTASQKQEAVFLDKLSIPCPGEVFAAMNKACRPNWVTFVTPATAPVTTDRAQLAMIVGVLASNGYIAVEAQDGQQVKNVGREMMAMAKALGVSENLMGRGTCLMEFAENNAWDSLADELEATENEIKTTMVEQKDHNLVTLTSAAAWLRGLDVATTVVLATNTLQGIAVLRQSELARHLASQIGSLPERMKNGTLASQLKKTLDDVAGLLENMGSAPETERMALQKIHEKTAMLVQLIFISSASLHSTPSTVAASTPCPVPSALKSEVSPKTPGSKQ